ncbi:MAG: thymidylate kinase [Candidatus Parcubacteria bacterium]|nr:MAG: thymidylate kinase [Candidatus Parcubacteria bacterium]
MLGKLIIIEGIDGSGTTTQSKLLFKYLKANKINSILTKEPFNKYLVNLIKKNKEPIIDLFLFLADRSIQYSKVRQWLKEGKWIVSDRSFPSTLVYQWYLNEKLKKLINKNLIIKLNNLSQFNIQPDMVIVLDINPQVAIKRLKNKIKKSKISKFEKLSLLKNLSQGYLFFAKKLNWNVIDGNLSINEVHKNICQKIINKFNLKIK